jgi:hypothetical protein
MHFLRNGFTLLILGVVVALTLAGGMLGSRGGRDLQTVPRTQSETTPLSHASTNWPN